MWLETAGMPGIEGESITHQQLLRSMDALMDHQGDVDDCVAHLLRPLIDEDLSVVFYDLTTIRTEGLSPSVVIEPAISGILKPVARALTDICEGSRMGGFRAVGNLGRSAGRG